MKMFSKLASVILIMAYLFFIPFYAHSEQWNIVLDNGQGSGSCTFSKQQDGTVKGDGNWQYNDKGTIAYGTYVNAPVTIEGTSISIKATGTATIPSSPPGYNTSPYVLTINGKALNGTGGGAYQMTYSNPFWWPNKFSGTWAGTRTSGKGITAETKTMPWLYLLLRN